MTEHKTRRTFTGPLYPDDTPVIDVWHDNERRVLTTSEFGDVGSFRAADQVGHMPSGSRMCVHRLTPMPTTVIFTEEWLREIGWQPTTVNAEWAPVIAARSNGVVMLAFDVMGPTEGCTNLPHRHASRVSYENRWNYKLYPMQWTDIPNREGQLVTMPAEHLLLGVLKDAWQD